MNARAKQKPVRSLACYHDRRLLEFDVEPNWPGIRCASCGITHDIVVRHRNSKLDYFRIFPGPRYIVDGFVTLCTSCKREVLPGHRRWSAKWTGVPVLTPPNTELFDVIAYRFVDDTRLARLVGQVWQSLPANDQCQISAYLKSDRRKGYSRYSPRVAPGRLRIEALPAWPDRGRLLGVCAAAGHVIRLNARRMNRKSDRAVAALFAHELAHTYQHAIRSPLVGLPHERDAKDIAARWGWLDYWIDLP